MKAEYDFSSESKLPEDQLRPSTGNYRSHADAKASTEVPTQFIWEQAIDTGNFMNWLGVRFPALPQKFSRGTILDGDGVKGVVGHCQPNYSFHLYFDNNLLVIEAGSNSSGAGPDSVRLCLDIFYSSRIAWLLANEGKQKARVENLLQRFIKYCEEQYAKAARNVQ